MPSRVDRRGTFAGHDVRLETPRLKLRPFVETDLDTALVFYQDREFLEGMEGELPSLPVTRDYLEHSARAMTANGFYFAIVERATGRTIGEVCLQWMNLERGKVPGEKIMRLPIGIWDKTLWGRGYAKEVVWCLMAHAFENERVDRFCAMDVDTANLRSQRLWQACGLRQARVTGRKIDFELDRADYAALTGCSKQSSRPSGSRTESCRMP